MVIGNIEFYERYNNVHKDFQKTFEYLKKLDKSTVGRFEITDGVSGTTAVSSGSDSKEKPFEAHRKYLDIHYIVSGKEAFGYSNIDSLQSKQEYSEEGDYELLEGDVNTLVLNEGDFCIVFPEDAHIPCMKKLSDTLVRTVVKIKCVE